MSPQHTSNEIVRALTTAIQHALEAGDAQGLPVARDVAQVLGLDGLDRALRVCRPDDPGTEPITRRLRALCEQSEAEGSLERFIAADAELGLLAVECGAVIEGEPGLPPEGTLGAAEALGDLPLDDEASRAAASRVRLTPQVSAALRAAVDWLFEGDVRARGIRLRTEDSALEMTCPRVNPERIEAAAKVISAIGGNLGPATSAPGAGSAWVVRVPIATARETFLMVSQGDLDLALPWHAVLRVSMTPRAGLDASMRALGHPVLAPFVPLVGRGPECPIVLVALGLRRAYFVADRLVWRLPAETHERGNDSRTPGHPRSVRTEDGKVYRVADPARLLEDVPPIAIAAVEPNAGNHSAPHAGADTMGSAPVASGVATVPASELDAAMSTAAVSAAAAPLLDAARVMPLPLRALVAEDSISARLSLAQMLEGHGLEVHSVGTAAALFEALAAGPWALVCVDAELPDARGVELLQDARARAREQDQDTEIVALVRDSEDEALAFEARIVRSLRKPCGRAAVARLIAELGLEPENE